MVAKVSLVGKKQFLMNLTRIEKKVLPKAKANALNRAATLGRKNAIKEIARHEKRKPKGYRSIIRVTKRARAKVSMYAVVTLFSRRKLWTGKVSKPFIAKGKEYRRRIPGKARTSDRPRTSPPNLPIYPTVDEVALRRERMMRENCADAMRQFYPREVRAQIDKILRRQIRRGMR